jgi:hypothetical protein
MQTPRSGSSLLNTSVYFIRPLGIPRTKSTEIEVFWADPLSWSLPRQTSHREQAMGQGFQSSHGTELYDRTERKLGMPLFRVIIPADTLACTISISAPDDDPIAIVTKM